ncbi:thermonuclease family protein [Sphingomonas sp. BK069]|uniref:thermonuclease family protein n=1 Tax=Sphingomonas sp. BK069 TaxID=2586979 RepID=UPI00161ACDC7|nr:thermonuclease family protein [Sphingomonas sp. BK069]MBB3346020.1 endonuclease YncB(thermonuclease family) [Sphingomonas sp. BK069]
MLTLALLAAVIVPAGESFRCTPVRVWDGDGPIWCAEGPRLRIADIAARELDGSCRRGHPCPKASGIEARDALVELLGGSRGTTRDGHVIVAGPPMQCRSRGPDRYRRTVAACSMADDRDLGHSMVMRKVAVTWAH